MTCPESEPQMSDSANRDHVTPLDSNAALPSESASTPSSTGSVSGDVSQALLACRQEEKRRAADVARGVTMKAEATRRHDAFNALMTAVKCMENDCYRSRPASFDPTHHPATLVKCLATFVSECSRPELRAAWQAVDQQESLLALIHFWGTWLTSTDVQALYVLACRIVEDCLAGEPTPTNQLTEMLRAGSGVNAPRWAAAILGSLAGVLPWPDWLVRVGNADVYRPDVIAGCPAEGNKADATHQANPADEKTQEATKKLTNTRWQDWALGIEHGKGAWHLFHRVGGDWWLRHKVKVAAGYQEKILEALVNAGGFLPKMDAIKLWSKHPSPSDIPRFLNRVKTEIVGVRKLIRKVVGVSGKTSDPLCFDRHQKGWRLAIQIGVASQEDGTYIGGENRLRFKPTEQLSPEQLLDSHERV
jgi:hypothetical protein